MRAWLTAFLILLSIAATPAWAAAAAATAADPGEIEDLLEFGVEMAVKGNWREARYRWERADAASPGDSRVLNNLAVSAEALGQSDEARALYARALAVPGADYRVRENALRSDRFWSQIHKGTENETPRVQSPPARDMKHGKRRDAIDIDVTFAVPPRLDLKDAHSLLVASFLTDGTDLVDINREIVRYLRGEFKKRTALDVLDVTPPPAIPEQTLEDLIANAEFWKHLGEEYRANVIVSGAILYDRKDISGFRDVDVIDDRTGQKVRTTRFVEQEKFEFDLEVFFFDGATGGLMHRDRLERSTVYRGLANDPITAFYELSETIAGDVLAVISQSTRTDQRVLFKR